MPVAPPSRRARPRLVAGLTIAAAAMTALACGAAGAQSSPTWVPRQTPSPVQIPTVAPPQGGGGSSSAPGSGSAPTAPPSSGPTSTSKQDPNVVATRLAAPTGIAVLPDQTALVGERTTGRIVVVQPMPGQPVTPFRTLTGLSTDGGGGLLDLALSPSYAETGLVLALITTPTDTRVVQFTRTGPVTPVLAGIPRGGTHNIGRLYVQGDAILVGTGDAGTTAPSTSLAGKLLRVTDLGAAAPDNPTSGSRAVAGGYATVDGVCGDATGRVLTTSDGDTDLLRILPAPGSTTSTASTFTLPASIDGVGGCAVSGRVVYFAAKGGQAIFQAPLSQNGQIGPLTPLVQRTYGRILSVTAAPDGTIWATTTNKDGFGKPVPDDERVLHIKPSGGGGTSPE